MALQDSAISQVRTLLDEISAGKPKIEDCINTINYVKSNNDISIWTDGTAVGSQWEEKINEMINQTSSEVLPNIEELIQQTNNFLDEQQAYNNNVA